jgi:hypothetical protein
LEIDWKLVDENVELRDYFNIFCDNCHKVLDLTLQSTEEKFDSILWAFKIQNQFIVNEIEMDGYCFFRATYIGIQHNIPDFQKTYPHFIWWMQAIITSSSLSNAVIEVNNIKIKQELNRLISKINKVLKQYNSNKELVIACEDIILEEIGYSYDSILGDLIVASLLNPTNKLIPCEIQILCLNKDNNGNWCWQQKKTMSETQSKEKIYLWNVMNNKNEEHYNVLYMVDK